MMFCWKIPVQLSSLSLPSASCQHSLVCQAYGSHITRKLAIWFSDICVSLRIRMMEIPVIGYYCTTGSKRLGKRSSYESHCSKKSPFYDPLKSLIAMAALFKAPSLGPSIESNGTCLRHLDPSAGSFLFPWAFVVLESEQHLQKAVRLGLFLQCFSGISKPALAKVQ